MISQISNVSDTESNLKIEDLLSVEDDSDFVMRDS